MPVILAIAAAGYLLAGLALICGLCRTAASSDTALAAHRRRAHTAARR